MKVLFLSQGRKMDDQIGYNMAFLNAQSFGRKIEVRNIPWIGYAETHGCNALWNEILRVNKEFAPDLVFFQRFHSPLKGSPVECINALKKSSNSPLIFGDLGDLFQPSFFKPWRRPIPHALHDVVQMSDLFFTTSMGTLADYLLKLGAKKVALLPLAFSNYHFPDWAASLPVDYDYDVVMVGSAPTIRKRYPLASLHLRFDRKRTVDLLWKRYGKRFGLFGYGWEHHPAWRGVLPFNEQIKLYKSSRVCIDAKPPYPNMYYGSNRPFYIAGSGSMLVQYHTPRFEQLLKSGTHSNYISNHDELVAACDTLIERDAGELRKIGEDNMQFVQNHHTVDMRVDTIISFAEAMRAAPDIQLHDLLPQLRCWHFHDEVNLMDESRFAIRSRE